MSNPEQPKPAPAKLRIRAARYLWHSAKQVLFLLALYVLSIGPMYWHWFGAMHVDGSPYVAAFYMPLLYACEVDVVGDVVNWYIQLWIL